MKNVAIKLPDVGEGVTEAELVEWNVSIGDIVLEDDILAAVMTDKTTVEIPSICAGKIVWLGGELGEVIAVGAELVRIEIDASVSSLSAEFSGKKHQTILSAQKPAERMTPAKVSVEIKESSPNELERVSSSPSIGAPREEGVAVLASPSVRDRARKNGIDLRKTIGTGPAGRITHADIDGVFEQPTEYPARSVRNRITGKKEIKIIGLRKKIAKRMALANAEIPHITIVEEIDVTALEELRAKLNESRNDKVKLTILPLFVAALVKAIEDHPEVNACFDGSSGIITRYGAVNVGIATMTEKGLKVPVIQNAEAKGVWECAAEIKRLSEAARDGSATRSALTGSTITVTSLGPLGAVATTPIINYPEVAIVGINKIAVRPMWDGTQFVPRKMMNISSSFDHRVIDGWDAAVFVQRIKTLLETPALIFMEL